MHKADVIEALRHECDKAGGQKHWAIAHGVSQAHVSYVLNGNREPGHAICTPLGLRRIVLYKRMADGRNRSGE